MSEENLNPHENEAPVSEPDITNAAPAAEPAPPTAGPAQQDVPAEEPAKPVEPQVIVQTERGFAHYVGFALLFVLCLAFYFAPGIGITYAINLIPGVNLAGIAAWVLSVIFSVMIWLIIKLMIKGFKKSFYMYIALCIVVFAVLVALQVAIENSTIFADILAMLAGAAS